MSILLLVTKSVPKDYHFDGEREMGAALVAFLSPDLFVFEVQLPMIRCDFPVGEHKKKRWPDYYFDLRLTFTDQYKGAVFVRN